MPTPARHIALTRPISPRLAECELTHLAREPIDIDLAKQQHASYCEALRHLGCEVRILPAAPDLPDGVFVEDAAVVLDEIAVITRPGAVSRRPETPSVEAALREDRRVERISAPATMDGGDVLRVGRTVVVGLSQRTNEAAVDQMRTLLEPLGYRVAGVPVTGCLHLKSAATAVAAERIIVNPAWLDIDALRSAVEADFIDVDPAEPRGANHLLVGDAVISPTSCPRTVDRLRARGIAGEVVDVSALERAESGVTCSSIIFAA